MSLRQKYLRILTEIAPVGATGLSLLIGSTTLSVASNQLPEPEKPVSTASVSERLAAIREAVSDITQSDPTQAEQVPGVRLAKDSLNSSKMQQSTKPPTTTSTPRTGGGNSGRSAAPNSRWGWPNWNNWKNWTNRGNWFRN
jgi:septal ring-binding cell division protein DamX